MSCSNKGETTKESGETKDGIMNPLNLISDRAQTSRFPSCFTTWIPSWLELRGEVFDNYDGLIIEINAVVRLSVPNLHNLNFMFLYCVPQILAVGPEKCSSYNITSSSCSFGSITWLISSSLNRLTICCKGFALLRTRFLIFCKWFSKG